MTVPEVRGHLRVSFVVNGETLGGEQLLLRFFDRANSRHPDILFTYVYGRSVLYLDVETTRKSDHIITDLFSKPINTHQYLLPSSNHPPQVDRDLPYGLGLRLRAIISEPETLGRRLKELSTFLTARGYSPSLISCQFAAVRATVREAVLPTAQRPG